MHLKRRQAGRPIEPDQTMPIETSNMIQQQATWPNIRILGIAHISSGGAPPLVGPV